MKIIAFYSFKGGVGRTSALLNVGYLLASRRRATVALADWDIHAPGLTCLEDLQPTEAPRLRPGVVDVLASLAAATPDGDVLDPAGLVHPTRVGRRIADTFGGDLWLVPAGAFDPAEEESEFLTAVQHLQPQIQGLARAGKGDLVTWFGERVAAGFKESTGKALDYLLLDARTGLTEVGDLLLSDATDQVVLVFGLNAQNQIGMEQTLRQLVARFGAANVASRVLLVASPVPAGEEAIKARRLAAARAKITDVVEELTQRASVGDRNPISPAAPRLLTIPYHPLLALEEAMIAEHYPESDPGRAYAAIEEAVRSRGTESVAESKVLVAGLLENLSEERTQPSVGVIRGDNPFARPLRWNVVRPEATAEKLAAGVPEGIRESVLQGLANSIMPEELRRNVVEVLLKIDATRAEELEQALRQEQTTLRELGTSEWPALAENAGRSWAGWALLSAERLEIDRGEVGARLFGNWPCRLDGEVGVLAALAALDILTAKKAASANAQREFLARVIEANPGFDLALGSAAAWLVELGDGEAARPLFEGAVALPPVKSSFDLAVRIQTVGERLLSHRQSEAMLLLEKAEQHYARALALEPDMHGAESNWGAALSARAKAVAERDLEKALRLWEQAGQHYARALALKPDMHEAEFNWGAALHAQAKAVAERDQEKALGLWEQAGQHYARALALKPDMHDAEFNWGIALGAQAKAVAERDLEKAPGLWEQAGQHYTRALALKPDMHAAESNWGIALNDQAKAVAERDLNKALGLWEQAEQHYARALALKPDMHAAESNAIALESARYHALRSAGRDREAQAAAEHALELAERSRARTGKPSYNFVCALCLNGRADEAIDGLETLHKSSSLGVDAAQLASDPDLASVREHPRFLSLLALVRAASPISKK